jgi:phospholipid/cholesterol/gamma-HCH transport system substrate-binding protein
VQRNLDGLGPGVKGRGADINRLFAALPPTATQGDRTLGLLKAQRAQVAAIVDNTGAVMQAFADRTQQVRTLARQGKATAIAVRDRDEQFGAALRELPPTLERARSSVANLASFATNATPVMRDLSVAFKDLTPVMRDLTPAARSTRELFDELPPFLDVVDPALEQLSPFAEQLRPAVGSTDAFLRQVNPALEFLQPYREELGSFFPNAGSAVDATDAVGHLGRVHAVIAPSSFTGLDANTKKALDALIAAGGLSQLVGEKVNGYPRPGTVGEPDTKSNFRQVATPGGK